MKKYKVKKAFFDKETGEPYSVGDTYQTDNEERAKTLQAGGCIAGGNVSESDTGKEKTGGGEKPAGGGDTPEGTKVPKPDEKEPAGGGDTPEGTKEPKPDEKKPAGKTDK